MDSADDSEEAVPAGGSMAPVVESRDLLGSGREITIRHNGDLYRLKVTRQGKLILTK